MSAITHTFSLALGQVTSCIIIAEAPATFPTCPVFPVYLGAPSHKVCGVIHTKRVGGNFVQHDYFMVHSFLSPTCKPALKSRWQFPGVASLALASSPCLFSLFYHLLSLIYLWSVCPDDSSSFELSGNNPMCRHFTTRCHDACLAVRFVKPRVSVNQALAVPDV